MSVPLRRALRLLGTLALIALVTFLDFRLFHFNSASAAFTYLLIVLGLATRVGRDESILASVAGMLCYNYFFLPPIGTLTIADPQNWVALAVFLITAMTASHLSTNARQRAEEASRRRREMERLYEFSRSLMLNEGERTVACRVAQLLAEAFGEAEVRLYERATGTIWSSHDGPSPNSDRLLRETARESEQKLGPNASVAYVPVRLGGRVLGSIALPASAMSSVARQSVAQLVAIALERERSQQEAARLEAARQNEQLKSTLLDALAHEFKTPLTSIKAAVSTVLSLRSPDPMQRELLTVVDEEADRLTNLVTEAITMARIDSGRLQLRREQTGMPQIMNAAITQLRPFTDERTIEVEVEHSLPESEVDRSLMELVLRQLLGNALKYGPPSAPIRITARAGSDDSVVLSIENEGTGIPPHEQEAVFERFYRGRDVRDLIPGTGLGLTIAREIVKAHGGQIWLESDPDRVRVSFSLPAMPAQKQAAG